MDAFFYWTGVVVVGLLALGTLYLIAEGFVGLAASISWHRWALQSPTSKFSWRKHGAALLWSVLQKTWQFYGYRNDGSLCTYSEGGGGSWRGIGDWNIG